MHGTMNVKFIEAKQAKQYTNIKTLKVNCTEPNAAVWFIKACWQKQLTPTYINIRINGNNQQRQRTLRTATKYGINQEIKFLYTNKLKLNQQLFRLHLECADKWQNTWPIILQSIDQKLTQ
jgi:hypothetical protein